MSNSRGKNRSGKSNRDGKSDLELWHEVARSVTPLKDRVSAAHRSDTTKAASEPADSSPRKPKRQAKPRATETSAAPRQANSNRSAEKTALTGLDRRTSQKLARGNAAIDARVDLHGLSRDAARGELLAFLLRARDKGHRTILVITGKGQAPYARHTLHGYSQVDVPEREGILRRALPTWLNEPAFREHVSGYQPAHPRHGGGGAFYVRLRKTHRGHR